MLTCHKFNLFEEIHTESSLPRPHTITCTHLLLVYSPDAVGQAVVATLWWDIAVDPLDLQEKLRPACWCETNKK